MYINFNDINSLQIQFESNQSIPSIRFLKYTPIISTGN